MKQVEAVMILVISCVGAFGCRGEANATSAKEERSERHPSTFVVHESSGGDDFKFDVSLQNVRMEASNGDVTFGEVSFSITSFFNCGQVVSPFKEESFTLLVSDVHAEAGTFVLSGGSVSAFSRKIVGTISDCDGSPVLTLTEFSQNSGYLSPYRYSWNSLDGDFAYVISKWLKL